MCMLQKKMLVVKNVWRKDDPCCYESPWFLFLCKSAMVEYMWDACREMAQRQCWPWGKTAWDDSPFFSSSVITWQRSQSLIASFPLVSSFTVQPVSQCLRSLRECSHASLDNIGKSTTGSKVQSLHCCQPGKHSGTVPVRNSQDSFIGAQGEVYNWLETFVNHVNVNWRYCNVMLRLTTSKQFFN